MRPSRVLSLQWIPEDPIHDPLPPTRLNQFEKDKKTLWARMNELGAFRDIDSYRQVVSELVPKGVRYDLPHLVDYTAQHLLCSDARCF